MVKVVRSRYTIGVILALSALLTACGGPSASPTQQTVLTPVSTTNQFANSTPAQGAAGPNSPGESASGATTSDPNIVTRPATTIGGSATTGATLDATSLTASAAGSAAPTSTGLLVTPNTAGTTNAGGSATNAGGATTSATTAGAGGTSGSATMAATSGTSGNTRTSGGSGSATMSATTGGTGGTNSTSGSATMAATSGTSGNAGAGGSSGSATISATTGGAGATTGTMAATMNGAGVAPCPTQMATMSATMSATMVSTMSGTMNANATSGAGSATQAASGAGTSTQSTNGLATASATSTLRPDSAYLGITGQDVPNCGVLITAIRPGAPAQIDGLQVGDIIISANNQPIRSNADLRAFLDQRHSNDRVTFMVVRGSQTTSVGITLMAQPSGTAAVATAGATPLGAQIPSTPASP